jgi:hypothetical protein
MRIHSFTAIAACVVLLVSCEKDSDEGACGAGYAEAYSEDDLNIYKQYTGTPTPGTTYYHYIIGSPIKVQFFVGFNAKSICTKEHMQINYEVNVKNVPQTLSMKIFGDAYWSAFSNEAILFDGIPTPGISYKGSLKAGLQQAFPQGGGDVDAFVNVEFNSSGSFASDSTYFVNHIQGISVTSKYSKF